MLRINVSILTVLFTFHYGGFVDLICVQLAFVVLYCEGFVLVFNNAIHTFGWFVLCFFCSFEDFLFGGVWNIMDTFKTILFCIGLILTLWRSYDCLLKHLNENLSTRVVMVPSYETLFPSLTLCPHYHEAYDLGKVFHTLNT